MNKILNSMAIRTLVLLFAASVTFAQAFAQDRVPFRQAELDQMLAPVALYPDSLLSQVLMASTYPLEVVQAARWSRANPGLRGQDAVRAVERVDWDPSVKSLTAFPQVLSMMDEQLDWTERLGEAFLAQQADVMDSVQALRRRAEAAGNLRSSEQMRVSRQGDFITIQQPAPEIVYVPHYNPVVAYGSWWWPAYQPFYWAPPVAYYVVPAHRPVFLWGPGIVISRGFFFGHCDWRQRHVTVVHNHITHVTVNRNVAATNVRPVAWQHDSHHRRDAPFRNPAARERFEQIRTASADTRRGADRRDAAPERREDRRDAAQDKRDDRRNAVQERREDKRDATANRIAPNTDANRDNERVRPIAQPQRPAPQASPEPRSVQPETRPQPNRSALEDRKGRPERDNANDRRERNEQKSNPRPQASTPNPAPRAEPNNPRGNGGGQDHGKDNQRERSAGRDNGKNHDKNGKS